MKQQKKNLGNIIMDCIIVGVIAVIVIVIASTFFSKEKPNTKDKKTAKETVQEQKSAKKDGVEEYVCAIASEGSNSTIFSLVFQTKDKTYTESLEAGNQKTEISKGSYEEKDGKYITESSKGKETITYTKDKDYLIVESQLYQGKLPSGDTFDKTFSYSSKSGKTTIHFKKDGTFEQEVVTKAKEGSSEKDTTENGSGTYTRTDTMVKRKLDSGEAAMDLYIYKDQLCGAYYKLVK